MKSLSDLRRRLRNYVGRPERTVTLTFFSPNGTERPGSQNAPVVNVKNQEFAVKRADGRYGYLPFFKAAEWSFAGNTATHTSTAGVRLIITFNEY